MITLRCKKIYDIDKNICTCEQKIAYNYAFSWSDKGKQILNADTPEFVKAEAIESIIDFVKKDIASRDDMKKYNHDAIIIAFRQGFKKYCKNWFIAADYESIGKAFPIPYNVI